MMEAHNSSQIIALLKQAVTPKLITEILVSGIKHSWVDTANDHGLVSSNLSIKDLKDAGAFYTSSIILDDMVAAVTGSVIRSIFASMGIDPTAFSPTKLMEILNSTNTVEKRAVAQLPALLKPIVGNVTTNSSKIKELEARVTKMAADMMNGQMPTIHNPPQADSSEPDENGQQSFAESVSEKQRTLKSVKLIWTAIIGHKTV